MSLMWACLALLEREEEAAGSGLPADVAVATYRPVHFDLFRVPEAIIRVRGVLVTADSSVEFRQCLPAVDREAANVELRARSAVASTLVAVLELARAGEVALGAEDRVETLKLSAPTPASRACTARVGPDVQ